MNTTLRLALFMLFCGVTAFAQRNVKDGDKLALQYYEQKEYEKANLYFENLFDSNPTAWYGYYFRSLLGAKEYDMAERITKKLLKQNKSNVYLYVNLGKISTLRDEPKKAADYYQRAIKELDPVQPFLENLANAFKEEGLYDYAIQTYNKGRNSSQEYAYFYERAEVYRLKNDLAGMINEYLDALDYRETEIQTVQIQLQNSLGYDDEQGGIRNPLLKQELQRRIQKNPQKIVFSEFLIFILKQQRDFDGAFVQSRALDKRLKEDGQRVYELARICKANRDWAVANRCYEYIIEKGPGNPYYDMAVIDGLEMEFLAVTQKPKPTTEELLALEQKLINAGEKYKHQVLNAQIVKNLASLQAFHLSKGAEAIALLEKFVSSSGLDAAQLAEFKLLLGDIHLIKGDIWEASLLYSQVEKTFKYEAIGNEAKFRNAKLSFYAGDFTWSKAQADVLKGSTSKLIANDALDLSLIITDAIGVDTNDLPLKLFASADLMILQHRYDEAIVRMDSINTLFSYNTLGDDIYYKKAQIYARLGEFTKAADMYRNILEYYPTDLYGDDALFKLAELYEHQLADTEKAKQTYEEMLTRYPGSIYTVESRKRFRQLRGDILNN